MPGKTSQQNKLESNAFEQRRVLFVVGSNPVEQRRVPLCPPFCFILHPAKSARLDLPSRGAHTTPLVGLATSGALDYTPHTQKLL